MSIPSVDAWLDDDGVHVWTRHPCVGGVLVDEMLPYPDWHVMPGGDVKDSFNCDACGAHQFLNVTHERWWPVTPEATTPGATE